MTRKPRRELADAVESMEGADAGDAHPRRWVQQYMETRLAGGWDFEWPDADGDGDLVVDEAADGQVCILDTGRFRFYVPQEGVPEWLDIEEDLPVLEQAP